MRARCARGWSPPGLSRGGKIVQRQAELGQRVKAGQVLAQLDPKATTSWRLTPPARRWRSHHAARPGGGRPQAPPQRSKTRTSSAVPSWNAATPQRPRRPRWTRPRRPAVVAGQPGRLHRGWWPDVSGVVTGIDAEPARWWRLAPRWCASRRTAPRRGVCRAGRQGGADHDGLRGRRAWLGRAAARWRAGAQVAASADAATRTFQVKVAIDAADAPRWAPPHHARGTEPRRHCRHQAAHHALRPGGAVHRRIGCMTRHQHRQVPGGPDSPRPMATMPWWPGD